MADELKGWAESAMGDSEDGEWRDFMAATFRPLAYEQALSARLAERFVVKFLSEAGLSEHRQSQALAMLVLEQGTTPEGRTLLRVSFPFTGSITTTEWDGTVDEAEGMIENLAESLAYDVHRDRDMGGPTGWEAEFDT